MPEGKQLKDHLARLKRKAEGSQGTMNSLASGRKASRKDSLNDRQDDAENSFFDDEAREQADQVAGLAPGTGRVGVGPQ